MLSDKEIIMIHGLASKPPERVLHELWANCVLENLKLERPDFLDGLDKRELKSVFRSAYWANAVPSHIEDGPEYIARLNAGIGDLLEIRKKKKDGYHVGGYDKFRVFFKNKGLDVVDILGSALSIKDKVAKAMLEEVRLYAGDQYIADKMRLRLESELRNAWDNSQRIAIISHSMGTFIAYDVLWRFSHRSEPEYFEYREKKVDLFVTMGSPLGDSAIQNMLFARRYRKDDYRRYPRNILRWHNYSCLGDIVAHDSTLGDDFHRKMIELRLIERVNARDYIGLYNPYLTTKGTRNPHKSYGYLVQPKLAKWLAEFLRDKMQGCQRESGGFPRTRE